MNYKKIKEASKISMISVSTLQRWRSSNKIKYIYCDVEKVFLYDIESIIELIENKNKLCSCGIYLIKNTQNHKKYIGSSNNIRKRWNKHKSQLNNNNHDNFHLQNAWNKYGAENFTIEVLENCTVEKLQEREEYFSKKYNVYDRDTGYNIEKIIDRRVMSEETKIKISNALKGRKKSKETRLKMGKAQQGRFVSKSTKIKIKLWHTGRKLSDNHKRNIGKSISGEKNGMYGRGHTKEAIEKIIAKRRKPVLQKDMNGEKINTYPSAREASRQTGISQTQISKCCVGQNATAHGFRWEYV